MNEHLHPAGAVTLNPVDFQIGAVELKDGVSETRAAVDAAGRLAVVEANSEAVKSAVDGLLPPLSSLNGKDFATQATLAALDGKVTACNTGAVVVAAQPPAAIKPDAATLSLHSGTKTVAAPGTAEALAAGATPVWRADIQALPTNTGKVYVGSSDVDKDSLKVAALGAGQSYTIECPAGCRLDLATVFLDADTAGEGVAFNFFSIA